ncbi:Small monomeric GTPase [Bertholletia excelsa]
MEKVVLEARIEESAASGSHRPRDSEGNEIFEEAIGVNMPGTSSEDIVLNQLDNDDTFEDFGGPVEVRENLDVGNEVEKFEEAAEVLFLDSYEDKLEGSVGGEAVEEEVVREVIKEEDVKEVLGDKIKPTDNDVLVRVEQDMTEDASDFRSGENGILEYGYHEDQGSSLVDEKGEKNVADIANLEGMAVDEILDNTHVNEEVRQFDKETQAGDGEIVLEAESRYKQEVESGQKVLHEAGMSKNAKETLSLLDTDNIENEDVVTDLHTNRDEKVKYSMDDLDTEGTELKEEAPASAILLCQNEKNGTLKDMAEMEMQNLDVRSQELRYASATIDSNQQEANWQTENEVSTFIGRGTGVEEGKVSPDVGRSPGIEICAMEIDEKFQTSASDLSQKKFDEDKGSKTSRVIKEPEDKVAKVDEVKQSNQGNKKGEIKSRDEVSQSSGKSESSSPAPAHTAGLGRAAPLLEPAPRTLQQPQSDGTLDQIQNQLIEEPSNEEAEENDETREKLQMIRVKFLRLAYRLGQTPHNVVVAQVLYRLGLAEQLRGRNGGRVGAFSFDRASAMAEQLEAAGEEPLDFSCTIMVLGETGVGKSATINSIFDEVKFGTDAFQLGTKKVQDVVGTVQGIKVRVIDTPGLLPSWSDQRQNEKILHSLKRFIKKSPPDIVLYLDRLDMQSRDFGDMPLLQTITKIFGPSIWFKAIVVLTHAASAPPEGPNGTTTSYDMFVTQRSHVIQQAIRQAAGDMRLMNPVSLVENHSACRTNRAGQKVLPNGQVWKPHLLLLSFASKILVEANELLKLQDSPPGKPFATRTRAPPLPFLLSSFLQSRPQLKLPEEHFGDDDTMDDDLDDSSDSDVESEYDELPPLKRLTKAQLSKLGRPQKKAYYDELEYREKLFMKKQLKEEKKQRKAMKKMAASSKDLPSDYDENIKEENGDAASVPVPVPDLALPASFDSDNPTHRYRYLDTPNQGVVRPVLDNHGWDHDIGYEGVNVERLFVVKQEIPLSFSGQVTKDKKDTNLQMEIAGSFKHGEAKATSVGFDMQTLGKDIAYTIRSETRFCNYKRNKATAGLSLTVLGDALSAGLKFEDKLIATKRLRMVVSGGAMTGRGDVAYGGSLEATLRDRDHPLGRSLSTLGLSVMDWHGDLAVGGNLQSQIPIGRCANLIARANLNNRGSGQVSFRLNSSEQFQIALFGLLPLLRKLLGYSQQLQSGQP